MKDIIEKYNNSREKMTPDLQNKLKSNTTDLANNPAIPKVDKFGNPINFLEMVAYKRFLEIVERVKRYTNIQDLSGQDGMLKMQRMLYDSVMKIVKIESTQKKYLENLAVDLVVEEMKIPDGAFLFSCKIVPMGSVSKDGFQDEIQLPNQKSIENAFGEQSAELDMTPNELFELEKHKRRFINLLIQGSSKKGHYMYLMVQDKLQDINPELSSLYGKMMSINDLTYWIVPDSIIKQMASEPSNMAGKEEIDTTTNPPTIKTSAVCFPVSIHEIIKGIMEVFGTQGLPDEPQMAQMVIDSVDSLSNETTDLRLGVGIWEIFYNSYPPFVFEDEYKHIQHYMFSRFCALEVEEFFRVAKMILMDEEKGKKYMSDLANEIKYDLQERDYNNTMDYDDDMSFANGGSADDMTMIARAIEYITGTAIDRDSIVDKGWKFEFKYKGTSYVSSLDSKLVRDTIYSSRKSLQGRYSNGGKADDKSFNEEGKSSLVYHEKQGNWIVPKGQVYFWLYEGEDSAEKVNNGEYDFVQYPLTSRSMAWQSGYIPPLKRIWTKKFQKDHKGSEHLLGVIKSYLIEKDGKKELYIDMMSVNPKHKKEGIMTYMIQQLRERFKLSQDQITFSDLTKEGEKFVAKKTYADGGNVEYKVNGLTKQDYIDLYLKRANEIISKSKENQEYDARNFDLLQEVDAEGGFTNDENVGWWLDWGNTKGTNPVVELMDITDYINEEHETINILQELFFEKPIKFKVTLETGGDFELGMIDEMEKIKLLSNKFDFDEVKGNIDYEEIDNNTNLTFYKNGNEVMSLVGYWEDDELKSTIELGDNTVELNYHPQDSMGGLSLVQLKENIDLAFKELNTFSAVISVDGYEEYAEDVEGLENAKKVMGNIKDNTRFQLLKGSSVGIGKRVDSSRVIEEFAEGGVINDVFDVKDLKKYLVYKYAGFNYHYIIGDYKYEINEFNDQKGWALNTYKKYKGEWHLIDSYGYEGLTLRECKEMIVMELRS
jgi:hypothetical protein